MKANITRAWSMIGAAVLLSMSLGTAWAHDRHGYSHRYMDGHRPVRYVAVSPPAYYVPPPVYVATPVYYAPPPVHVPPPAYYAPSVPARYEAPAAASGNMSLGAVGGAIAGAAIGSTVGQGNGRVAAIAIGTVLGSMIGGR